MRGVCSTSGRVRAREAPAPAFSRRIVGRVCPAVGESDARRWASSDRALDGHSDDKGSAADVRSRETNSVLGPGGTGHVAGSEPQRLRRKGRVAEWPRRAQGRAGNEGQRHLQGSRSPWFRSRRDDARSPDPGAREGGLGWRRGLCTRGWRGVWARVPGAGGPRARGRVLMRDRRGGSDVEEKEAETGGTGRQPGDARGGREDPALEGVRPQDTDVPRWSQDSGKMRLSFQAAQPVAFCCCGSRKQMWLLRPLRLRSENPARIRRGRFSRTVAGAHSPPCHADVPSPSVVTTEPATDPAVPRPRRVQGGGGRPAPSPARSADGAGVFAGVSSGGRFLSSLPPDGRRGSGGRRRRPLRWSRTGRAPRHWPAGDLLF